MARKPTDTVLTSEKQAQIIQKLFVILEALVLSNVQMNFIYSMIYQMMYYS